MMRARLRMGVLSTAWVGACWTMAACAHTPKPPTAVPEILTYDVDYGQQTLAGASLGFPWELNNLTALPARVEKVSWTLELQGEQPQRGEEPAGSTAAPNDKVAGRIVVTAPTGTTDEAFAARAKEPGLRFNLKATFTVVYGETTDAFEAEWRGEIFPPRLLDFSVRPQASRSGQGAELSFVLVVTNPNPFELRAEGLDYAIAVADVELSKGTVGVGQNLGPGTDTEFDVAQQIDKKRSPDLVAKLGAKSVGYNVQVELRTGERAFTKRLTGEIVFPK